MRRLPVTDDGGRLVGVISLSDLAKHAHFVSPAKEDGTGVGALARVMEAVSRARNTVKVAAQAQRSAKRSKTITA